MYPTHGPGGGAGGGGGGGAGAGGGAGGATIGAGCVGELSHAANESAAIAHVAIAIREIMIRVMVSPHQPSACTDPRSSPSLRRCYSIRTPAE